MQTPSRISIRSGSALCGAAIVLIFVKPSLALAAVGSVLPVVVAVARRREWRPGLYLLAVAVGVFGFLFVPEFFWARDDVTRFTFAPTDLFMIHARQIQEQMRDDLAANFSGPVSRERLEKISASLETEIAKAAVANRKNYPSLGFDPDYLMYREGSTDAQLTAEFAGDLNRLCDFYRFYYRRTWRRHPKEMLEKIMHQMAIFYSKKCPAYDATKQFPLTDL